MSRSLNEVMGLAAKAARGAGAPPAQAVRYGQAAVTHLCAGRAADDLVQVLKLLPEGPVLTLPLALARLCEAPGGEGVLEDAGWPDLALSYVQALPFAASIGPGLQVRLDTSTPAAPSVKARCELPQALQVVWEHYAERRLVPESEASRRAGAGAGLTDND